MRAAEHVVSHREFRPERALRLDERIHGHGLLVFVAEIKQPEVVEIRAVVALRLNIDLPLEAEAVEVIHEIPAEEGLHGLIGFGEIHALDHRLGFIHIEVDLRHIPQRGCEKAGELRASLRGGHEFLRVLRDDIHRSARAVLEHEGHATGRADAGNGGRRKGERGGGIRERTEFAIDIRLDGIDGEFRCLAFRPLLERDEKEARVGARNGAEEIEADDRGDIFHAWGLKENLLDLAGGLGGLLEGRGARELDHAEEVALILLGDERGGHRSANSSRSDGEADEKQHRNRELADQTAANGGVSIRRSVEEFVEATEKRTERAAGFLAGTQEKRAKRGTERKGVEGRDQYRHGHRDGELLIHRTGDSRNEHRRNEHRCKDKRDGDDGARDL